MTRHNPLPMPGPPSMFDAPRPAASDAPAFNYIQPNLLYGLKIWWAFYWRTTLTTYIVAAGAIVLARRAPSPATLLLARYSVYAVYYPVAFLVLAYVLRKNFETFRIGLVSRRAGEETEVLSATFQRTGRVWWTFTWRSVVYRIITTVVVMFPLGWTMGFLTAILPAVVVTLAVQVVLDAVVGMFVIYSSILDEEISDFRVTLLPNVESTAPLAAKPVTTDLTNG
jgi:hypothetical protein